jgi:hypothetical protein
VGREREKEREQSKGKRGKAKSHSIYVDLKKEGSTLKERLKIFFFKKLSKFRVRPTNPRPWKYL